MSQSRIYEIYHKLMVEKKYQPPAFKLLLGLKDVRLALAAADAAAVPMPCQPAPRLHAHPD